MARGSLISMLYSKTADLSITAADPASSMILMSADIERITTGWQTMHELWANVIEVGLAIYLLERQLGPACAVPIAVAISEYLVCCANLFSNPKTFSFYGRVVSCHGSSHVTSSHVARSHRKTNYRDDCHAQCDERGQDVWADRYFIQNYSGPQTRRIDNLQKVSKAVDMEHGIQ